MYIFQVGFDHFGAVVRVVDFYAVEGNFGAYFVEQGNVVEGEITLVAAGMGNEADGAAAVRGIDGRCHVRHE